MSKCKHGRNNLVHKRPNTVLHIQQHARRAVKVQVVKESQFSLKQTSRGHAHIAFANARH
mgnify:CR=1 FL=1